MHPCAQPSALGTGESPPLGHRRRPHDEAAARQQLGRMPSPHSGFGSVQYRASLATPTSVNSWLEQANLEQKRALAQFLTQLGPGAKVAESALSRANDSDCGGALPPGSSGDGLSGSNRGGGLPGSSGRGREENDSVPTAGMGSSTRGGTVPGQTFLDTRTSSTVSTHATGLAASDGATVGRVEVRTIGRVRVHVGEVLGRGRSGTFILAGAFEGKRAAVKVVPKRRPNTPDAAGRHTALIAQREAELMDLCENENAHPNVLRLFGCEEDASSYFLAQERCVASLHDLISAAREPVTLPAPCRLLLGKLGLWPPPLQQSSLSAPLRRLLVQLLDGLKHLHGLGILHCKLRPCAVLVNSHGVLKLSGLGLGRKEAPAPSPSHRRFGDSRQALRDAMVADGFDPPEAMRALGERLPGGVGGSRCVNGRACSGEEEDALSMQAKKAADMFSAGVLIFWCLTTGHHPFGEDPAQRRANVLRGELAALSQLRKLPEAQHLVARMLHPEAECRLQADQASQHPALWEDEQKLLFVRCVSDEPELTDEASPLVAALEAKSQAIFGADGWGSRLHAELLAVLTAHRSYQHDCVRDLLRAVRNCDHLQGMPPEVQRLLLPRPAGIARYFLPRFPSLFWSLYALVEHHWQTPKPRRVFEPFFQWSGRTNPMGEEMGGSERPAGVGGS